MWTSPRCTEPSLYAFPPTLSLPHPHRLHLDEAQVTVTAASLRLLPPLSPSPTSPAQVTVTAVTAASDDGADVVITYQVGRDAFCTPVKFILLTSKYSLFTSKYCFLSRTTWEPFFIPFFHTSFLLFFSRFFPSYLHYPLNDQT